jgi:hypothetical protein
MFLLKSVMAVPGRFMADQRRLSALSRSKLLAILVGVAMTTLVPSASADLLVGSNPTNCVFRYNETTGDFIDVFVQPGSGGLDGPRGLIFGHDGNLYVNSIKTNSVMRYDGTTGAPLPAPGQSGAFFVPNGSGGLEGPAGLILGRDGNLYVSSRLNNSVRRYRGTTGEFIDVFIPAGSGGLDQPSALVFGPDGNLYVHTLSQNVMRYDGTTGAPLPAPGQTGGYFVYGLAVGPGLVFGPDGNLYVPDSTNFGVLRFNGATGTFMDSFVAPGSSGPYFPDGVGVLFGPDHNLYVSSRGDGPSDSQVLRYDGMTGAFIDAFVPSGSGGLNFPTFLTFTNSDPATLAYVSPPRSSFLVAAPSSVVTGTPFDLTITALDPSGNIDPSYQGTVTFSVSDADPAVVLPADYTFTTGNGGDNGVHTFSGGVTLLTVGDQTLTVTDQVSGITGSATITVGPGP